MQETARGSGIERTEHIMAASLQLGDGLTVSPVGFGGMALTPVYGEVDQSEALKTLHHAVDAGVSIDTADSYGGAATGADRPAGHGHHRPVLHAPP
jgi:predicted aldo/keto reductase-like oxidoreductase